MGSASKKRNLSVFDAIQELETEDVRAESKRRKRRSWFLTQLAADYARWARDEPRTTAENASLASVAGKIIAGSRGKLPEGVRECECVEIVR